MKYFIDIKEAHILDRSFIRTIPSALRGEARKKLIEAAKSVQR